MTRISPTIAPPLVFGPAEQADAWRTRGANCGPGALAAALGITPLAAVERLKGFPFNGGTTEWMIRDALRETGVSFAETGPCLPRFGICRVQWDGPWIAESIRSGKYHARCKHSHWITVERDQGAIRIFDINAIGIGGWLDARDWAGHLVPWLLTTCEPEATGRWWISDVFSILIPPADRERDATPMGETV